MPGPGILHWVQTGESRSSALAAVNRTEWGNGLILLNTPMLEWELCFSLRDLLTVPFWLAWLLFLLLSAFALVLSRALVALLCPSLALLSFIFGIWYPRKSVQILLSSASPYLNGRWLIVHGGKAQHPLLKVFPHFHSPDPPSGGWICSVHEL